MTEQRTPFPLGRSLTPNHDERSRSFQAARSSALRNAAHRHYGPVLDQGQIGSCTGNALAQALNTGPLRSPGQTLLIEADAVLVYSRATQIDPYPGSYPPDDTGSNGLSVCKAAKKLRYITSYRHAFGLAHTLAALVATPVMVGTAWHSDMFTPSENGELKAGGGVAGGHEYVLWAIDATAQRVYVLNSWGPGWGMPREALVEPLRACLPDYEGSGVAWMSWATLGKLLDDGGDCTVPLR